MKQPILIEAKDVKVGMKVPAWKFGEMVIREVVGVTNYGENKLFVDIKSESGRIITECQCKWHTFSIISD